MGNAAAVHKAALAQSINLRLIDSKTVGISMDETTKLGDLDELFK